MKKNFLTQSRKKLLTQSEKKLLDIHSKEVFSAREKEGSKAVAQRLGMSLATFYRRCHDNKGKNGDDPFL